MLSERGANARVAREHAERERSERESCTGAYRAREDRTRELHGSMQSERGTQRDHAKRRNEMIRRKEMKIKEKKVIEKNGIEQN